MSYVSEESKEAKQSRGSGNYSDESNLFDSEFLKRTRELAALCSECWKDHPMRDQIKPMDYKPPYGYYMVCVNCDRTGR